MTKSEIFKAAHKTAKQTLSLVGDYRIAFQFALKEIFMNIKNTLVSIKDKLIEMGGKEHTEHNCTRVYLTQSLVNLITGFGYRFNETKHKFYYDFASNEVWRKTLGKNGKAAKIHHVANGNELKFN